MRPGLHVAPKQLDLQRDHGLANPHNGKDTAENGLLLFLPRIKTQQKAQQQAEDKRAPEIPLPQAPRSIITADQRLRVEHPPGSVTCDRKATLP